MEHQIGDRQFNSSPLDKWHGVIGPAQPRFMSRTQLTYQQKWRLKAVPTTREGLVPRAGGFHLTTQRVADLTHGAVVHDSLRPFVLNGSKNRFEQAAGLSVRSQLPQL